MTVEIIPVGGFDECGRNCVAVKVGDEVILLDLGLNLEPYINYTNDEDIRDVDPEELMAVNAVPDISKIEDLRSKVKAIVAGHAHLDHIGAIPYLGERFKAPVICTAFTAEVLKSMFKDEKIEMHNKIKVLNANSSMKISDKISIEFINVTHSIPQTVIIVIHTPDGAVVYTNDFKFDLNPIIGRKPNFKRLKEIGGEGVLALFADSTRSSLDKKTPSESVAKELLKDVLLGTSSEGKTVIVTTFASHLARLKSIIFFGKKLNRKILFLGRSLSRYVQAGENLGLINFSKDVELVKYGNQIKYTLQKLQGKLGKYLLVVTGHQGELNATLSKMADGRIPFRFKKDDHVVFSCEVIPTETNRTNREILENKLKNHGVRIFKDIHVSGHGAKEDIRDLIIYLKPKHILPSHGCADMRRPTCVLAKEMGYTDKQIHLLSNGERLKLP